jgi:large subunit ribosomal protein L14
MLRVADNSGALVVMCLRFLGTEKRYGRVGDVFVGVVKEANPNMPVKRSAVVRAVVVRAVGSLLRSDGTRCRFDDNAAVLLNKGTNPLGTRVFGPVARELRDLGFASIVSLADGLV